MPLIFVLKYTQFPDNGLKLTANTQTRTIGSKIKWLLHFVYLYYFLINFKSCGHLIKGLHLIFCNNVKT